MSERDLRDDGQLLPDWIDKLAETEHSSAGDHHQDELPVKLASSERHFNRSQSPSIERSFPQESGTRELPSPNRVIKSASEARKVLSEIAAVKDSRGNQMFDTSAYMERLASEDPQSVVRSCFLDIEKARVSSRIGSDERVAAKNTEDARQRAVVPKKLFELGRSDHDVGNMIKELMLNGKEMREIKPLVSEKFGDERLKAYLKEADDVISEFKKFLKRSSNADGISHLKNEASAPSTIKNRASKDVMAQAERMIHISLDQDIHISNIHKNLVRSFGEEIAKLAMDKHSSDVTEGKMCHHNLKLDKIANDAGIENPFSPNTQINTRREANRVLNFIKRANFVSTPELNKLQLKIRDRGNANTIRAFLNTSKPKKRLDESKVSEMIGIALKYASTEKKAEIKTFSIDPWHSMDALVEKLADNVLIVNKQAFRKDVERHLTKGAAEAHAFLSSPGLDLGDQNDGGMLDIPLSSTF